MARRYTKQQREIMDEWYGFTGWEFQEPQKGELFTDALNRNRQWLEFHTADAMHIGSELG